MGKNAEAFLELGRQAVEAADFHRAIEAFEQCIAQEGQSSQAWFYLGLAYLESGYIHQAIEAGNRAVELDGRHVDAHCLLGMAMGACGEIDRAAEYYQAALDLDPQHAQAAELLAQTKSLMASRTHYRKALKIMQGAQRKNGWLSPAMRELVQSLALWPSSPARADLAACVREILTAMKTTPTTTAAAGLDPTWARHCAEGYGALRREDWPTAADAYRKALQCRATDPAAHNALGLACFRSGDIERAVQAWRRVLELDPEFDFMRLAC